MYLKKILINGYLHFQSHHQSLVKTVVISCLRKRPERVYMDAPSMELQHLFNVRTGIQTCTQEDEQQMLLLPYIKGFSEDLPCLPPTQCQDCFKVLHRPEYPLSSHLNPKGSQREEGTCKADTL